MASTKKPVRAAKRAAPAKKTALAENTPAASAKPTASLWNEWAIVAAILGVVVVAAIFAARGSSPAAETTVSNASVATAAAPAAAGLKTVSLKKTVPSPAAMDDDPEPVSNVVSGAVEVTGCVQRDNDMFVLKDTDGAAPRSRSWKTGFLKKSSSSIGLTDNANRAHLKDHVGQRVSVTGTLIDREMHVQSLRKLATTCS